MRGASAPGLLALLAAVLPVEASPLPRELLRNEDLAAMLLPRNCASPCGAQGQFCCGESQFCTTMDNNVATCLNGQPLYTKTWTETHTYTTTVMTHWLPPPEPTEGVDCVPKNDQQEQCGPICCAGWQKCAYNGQCVIRDGYDEPSTIIITEGGVTTTQYSAPYRITGTTTVVTEGVHSDATSGAGQPTGTSDGVDGGEGDGDQDGGGGLSAGAIAGIVIGVLAALFLLGLLIFCCIVRGLWALLCGGRGKNKDKEKRERVEYEEEYYRGSRPPPKGPRHGGWFGGGGRTSSHAAEPREKKSGGKRWLGLAGTAATLLALLNMKKDNKPPARSSRSKGPRSRYSNSYYSYSGTGTSHSRSSSGRRTHRSNRTGTGFESRTRYTSRAGSRAP